MSTSPDPSSAISPARLRAGEWLAGLAGVVLLVDLLALHWYDASGVGTSATGWQALTVLRWLLLLLALGGIALALAQASMRAPAVPVTLAVILTVLGLITTIVVIIRVLLDRPGSGLDAAAGGYIGVVASAALLAAAITSLRQEGIRDADGPGEVPTVSLPHRAG